MFRAQGLEQLLTAFSSKEEFERRAREKSEALHKVGIHFKHVY